MVCLWLFLCFCLPKKICIWKIKALIHAKSSCKKTKHLVAFFCLVIPVGIWKVDVASCFFHHFFNIVATFADYMGMFCMWNIHLQGDSITLYGNKVLILDAWIKNSSLKHFFSKGRVLTKSDPTGNTIDFLVVPSQSINVYFLFLFGCKKEILTLRQICQNKLKDKPFTKITFWKAAFK